MKNTPYKYIYTPYIMFEKRVANQAHEKRVFKSLFKQHLGDIVRNLNADSQFDSSAMISYLKFDTWLIKYLLIKLLI